MLDWCSLSFVIYYFILFKDSKKVIEVSKKWVAGPQQKAEYNLKQPNLHVT